MQRTGSGGEEGKQKAGTWLWWPKNQLNTYNREQSVPWHGADQDALGNSPWPVQGGARRDYLLSD